MTSVPMLKLLSHNCRSLAYKQHPSPHGKEHCKVVGLCDSSAIMLAKFVLMMLEICFLEVFYRQKLE